MKNIIIVIATIILAKFIKEYVDQKVKELKLDIITTLDNVIKEESSFIIKNTKSMNEELKKITCKKVNTLIRKSEE